MARRQRGGVSVEIDPKSLRDFQRALREYEKATGKDASDVLNRAGGNLALRAVQKTKKATHADMRTTQSYDPEKRPANYRTRFHYALYRKKKGVRPTRATTRDYFKSRRRSRGYIAAGFLNAARDFGKRTRQRPIAGGDAARGYGRKAKPTNLTAWINNFADHADVEGARGLNAAMRFVAQDMLEYAHRRMQRSADRHSARRF